MKCYCYETDTEFVFCAEGASEKQEEILKDAWWKKSGDWFLKIYPIVDTVHGAWYNNTEEKEALKRNFARLGPSMFDGTFDWKSNLMYLAEKFKETGIEWYVIGSISEAVRGVKIQPGDMDIIVHTKDFFKVKTLSPENVIEPFVDNHGTWLVRYFGRLCVDGAIIDIAADDKMNLENDGHRYEKVMFEGHELWIEPLQDRYQVEIERKREDRIKAIEAYIENNK
jgi:hypothetical protein